jgi:tetratricopeptide (TPR) repeat protein
MTATNIIERDIHSFCVSWVPQRLEDKTGLPRLLNEFETNYASKNLQAHRDYLRLLVKAGDSGVTRNEICDQLFLGRARQNSIEQLESIRNRINSILLGLPSNFLSNYQIRIHPSPIDDPNFDDLARIESLVPTTGTLTFSLSMDRISFVHPQLSLACASYDSGNYNGAVEYFHKLLPTIQYEHIFTNSDIIQFLHYLSKTLIKLNWYDLLGYFLSGPYRRFSQLMQNELEAEILQIDGIRYRQQLDTANAQICFDQAIRLLEKSSTIQPSAKLSLNLSDVFVLQTQAYLDQAVCVAKDIIVQEASLKLAKKSLEQGQKHSNDYFKQSNRPTHYEGRLKGTQGFVTVAESIIFPEHLSEEQWVEAESDAAHAFQPKRDRKPFGIVAGKYALAIIWLAKGQWLLRQETGMDVASKALKCFQDGLDILISAYTEYIASGKVYLGPTFEMPKFKKAVLALNSELVQLKKNKHSLVNELNFSEEEQALIAQSSACIYTPIV